MSRRHSLPAEAYALVEQTPATVLLECGKPRNSGTNAGDCTRIFVAPVRVCVANEAAQIDTLFRDIEHAVAEGLTAAGFFTYECASSFEPKAGTRASEPGSRWPGSASTSAPIGSTMRQGRLWMVNLPACGQFRIRADQAGLHGRSMPISACLKQNTPSASRQFTNGFAPAMFISSTSRLPIGCACAAKWRMRTRRCARGSRLSMERSFTGGRARILSFSPELFFRVEEAGGTRRITTKPMKGTATRGRTTPEDRERAEWLRNDAKNQSENVMIVDLLRNDLGRLAKFGSVKTNDLFAVERFPTLWQMTSTVTGELREEVGFHDIFRALFPCGSITGAPKVRAMQLLAELEGRARGVYTGAIGYFSQRRTVFNVAIRTLELDGNEGTMGVGSGIVIDSNAKQEYAECVLKAEFLAGPARQFAEGFALIETLLWDGGYPLLQLHLDRLMDSAEYFGLSASGKQ